MPKFDKSSVSNLSSGSDAPVENPTPEPAPEPTPESTPESTPEPQPEPAAPTPEPAPEPSAPVRVSVNDDVAVNSPPVPAFPTPGAVSEDAILPNTNGVTVNDTAEPKNANVAHEATPEQVAENQQ